MLVIALMYIILPELSGQRTEQGSKLGFTAFVSLNFSMIFLVMALLIAGVVQVYLQRVMGMDFLEVQNHLRLWFEVRLVTGCVFLVGAVLVLWDLLRLGRTLPAAVPRPEPKPQPIPLA
jgi:nitric oxide reductase subunit B